MARVADGKLRSLGEYRKIDFLPDELVVPVPAALIEPPATVTDPTELISAADLAAIWSAVDALDLPDLDRMAAEHRAKQAEITAAESAKIDAEIAEADAAIAELKTALREHPFHDTTYRKNYQRSLRQRDRLEQERHALNDVLDREVDAEDVRIRNVIQGIRDVLHRFGYMQRGYPTEKADMLADIFDNDGLILCELIDRGTLESLAPEELAELFSWYSFDRDFRLANHFNLPERLVNARRRLEEIERDVLGEERDHKLFISAGHNPSFYGAALHWGRGWTMAQIGEQLELSEGDLVITFNKTIDLMRQVRDMLTQVQPNNPLVVTVHRAEKLLRRGIVEQSLTLGFTPIADEAVDAGIASETALSLPMDATAELEEASDEPPDDDVETIEDAASSV